MSGTSSSFQISEKVGFLHEKGGGIIKKFESNGLILVEDADGFERSFHTNELVKIHGTNYQLPENSISQLNDDDTISEARHTIRKETLTGYRKPIDVWEIDLHIESLIDSHRGMNNSEILAIQLKELKNFFIKAKSKHIRKLVIIHGVGEGVLKEEVRMFLSKKDGVEYYDADFREYGKGATSVELRYTQM